MTEHSQTKMWVTEARRGNELALTKLLTAYHRQLWARAGVRMPAALKAKTDPVDVLQDVYLDIFRQISRFEYRGPDSFLSWVYSILDRKLAAAWRAACCQARDVHREAVVERGAADSYWNLLDDLYAESATPSHVVRREEALDALLVSVEGLTESHRQVIQLRFLEELPVADVAVRLDLSEAAVVALTKRALEALRRSMDQLGEFTRGA